MIRPASASGQVVGQSGEVRQRQGVQRVVGRRWTFVAAPGIAPAASRARSAGRPTVSKARSGHQALRQPAKGRRARRSAPAGPRPRWPWPRHHPGSLAWNTPLMARCWLTSPSARSSADVRDGLGDGAPVGPGHQDDGVVWRASLSASSAALNLASCIFSPECGPEAGGPPVVALQKAAPGLGQAQQPQRVAGRPPCRRRCGPTARSGPRAARRTRRRRRSRSCRRPTNCSRTVASSAAGRRPTHLQQHALPIGFGGVVGVDVEHREGRGRPARGTGELRNSTPSISSRLDAASVLTSSTRLPASASASAAAADSEVLPTPPLPVKEEMGALAGSGTRCRPA